jgi:hypothetical protein
MVLSTQSTELGADDSRMIQTPHKYTARLGRLLEDSAGPAGPAKLLRKPEKASRARL